MVWNRNDFIEVVQTTPSTFDFLALEDNFTETSFKNLDFYIRFEHLDYDFEKLCSLIDIPLAPLVKRNASNHTHYSKYYDDELVEMVRRRFSYEIDFFDYKFVRAK